MKKLLASICVVVMTLCLAGCGKSIQEAKVGETVEFGKYKGNAIEWIVLKEENGRKLLLSKYAICSVRFNNWDIIDTKDKLKQVRKYPYSKSYVSKYLDIDFKTNCFTDEERKKIIRTKVLSARGAYQEESEHCIFLPISREIDWKYLACKPARYAGDVPSLEIIRKRKGQPMSDFDKYDKDYCLYWTRNTDIENANLYNAVVIFREEGVHSVGASDVGLRPMMWVRSQLSE